MIRVLEKIERALDGGQWNPGVRDSLENLEKIEDQLERIGDALNRICSKMPLERIVDALNRIASRMP